MAILSFIISYCLWCLWTQLGGEILPADPAISFFADTVAKALIWLGIGVLTCAPYKEKWLIAPKSLFASTFPWLPTLAGVCISVAFLHTVRILAMGGVTWGVFRPVYILTSAVAAVIEELAFRGVLFNRQAARIGVKWAVPVNGLFFALFHFPEFLLGQNLWALLGFHFWVVAAAGCAFSLAFAKWKHLGMPMLIHFMWNILCYLFALA